jgi:hypothetical protein
MIQYVLNLKDRWVYMTDNQLAKFFLLGTTCSNCFFFKKGHHILNRETGIYEEKSECRYKGGFICSDKIICEKYVERKIGRQ